MESSGICLHLLYTGMHFITTFFRCLSQFHNGLVEGLWSFPLHNRDSQTISKRLNWITQSSGGGTCTQRALSKCWLRLPAPPLCYTLYCYYYGKPMCTWSAIRGIIAPRSVWRANRKDSKDTLPEFGAEHSGSWCRAPWCPKQGTGLKGRLLLTRDRWMFKLLMRTLGKDQDAGP